MIIYINFIWFIYKNRLEKLKTKKLIKLWNLFDIYSCTEYQLIQVSNVLKTRKDV